MKRAVSREVCRTGRCLTYVIDKEGCIGVSPRVRLTPFSVVVTEGKNGRLSGSDSCPMDPLGVGYKYNFLESRGQDM